jgi:heme a synthase
VALLHAIDMAGTGKECSARTGALVLFAVIVAQIALGIATLLWVVPLPLALAHQAMAMLALTAATVHAASVIPGPSGARNPESITTDGAELSLKRTN